jgi:hypothetical protein
LIALNSLTTTDTTHQSPAVDIDDREGHKLSETSPIKDSVFKDFCRGQPPRRSFLNGTPPRMPMSRRSTLADKPELDTLLKVYMVQYKGEDFLPIHEHTVRQLNQYLNGSKPLADTGLFKRLLIDRQTNQIPTALFNAALEQLGVYCEHLVIQAPFHPMEFGITHEPGTGNNEPGSDWTKILECFPSLLTFTFEHPNREPTRLTRDTFYALTCALHHNTTLQEIFNIQLPVPPKLLFSYHKDHHSSPGSTPLCLVGADMIYADGPENFGSLDNGSVFGKAEDLEKSDD